ncbi:MAG: response regulator [Gammaproteobacteria bacterium]|nr:response regulator [Gammaproteobacteria bacterium]MBK9426058.1 response regulator [Gammaproteobacteria bacterium]
MSKVLIIDDSPVDTLDLAGILGRNGYTVISADDAELGLQVARDQQPDIVLMDIVMPGLNGFQATRLLTQGASTRHIPVVMVSNKDQQTDRVWGARQGARGYVTKPVRERELIGLIENLIP